MRLKEILDKIWKGDIKDLFKDIEIGSISCDSRDVENGSLFVALDGSKNKGIDFIEEAVAKGAKVVAVSQKEGIINRREDICYLLVDDPRDFLKQVCLKFYGYPSRSLRVIGITGTNGKTTTTYLIEAIFKVLGEPCGVVGTINRRIGDKEQSSVNTTPGFVDNQRFLSQLKEQYLRYCVMEVSSHGLDQGRVDGIDFKQAIFTNLTVDHLDYHKTMEDYFKAKSRLFSGLLEDAVAIINRDDPYAERFIAASKGKILTYGIHHNADIRAGKISSRIDSTDFELYTPQGSAFVSSHLVGQHNVYNVLAAVASGIVEGISLQNIKKGIESLRCVPGRLEPIICGQPFPVFIDYAHTPDALENVLNTLRQFKGFKVMVVFGCGGDRDKSKRPMMGKIASQLADQVIVTTDNPRYEDPQSIIDQIVVGFDRQNYEVIIDRTEAIHKALSGAKEQDIVLIAGKGHETYQVIKDQRLIYDEGRIIKDFFHV